MEVYQISCASDGSRCVYSRPLFSTQTFPSDVRKGFVHRESNPVSSLTTAQHEGYGSDALITHLLYSMMLVLFALAGVVKISHYDSVF